MTQFDALKVDLSGTHLVEASAGTGKTHAITSLYLRAIIERNLLPSQLLVVTFTRAATSEIKNRIRARLRLALLALTNHVPVTDGSLRSYLERLSHPAMAAERLRQALLGIDDAAIFTIHGFCQRVLEQHAFECQTRFDQTLLESLDELRDEALNDSLVAKLGETHPVLLRRFIANGGPERAERLLRINTTRPSVRIIPELLAPPSMAVAIEDFRRAQTVARRHFDFESIQRLLLTYPGLNRNKVSTKTLPARLATLARVLSPNAEVEPWPKRCILQQSYLETCLRNGARAPEHPFFLACDALHDEHQRLSEILQANQYALERACVSGAAALESSRKASLAVQGFDDLLLSLRGALHSSEGEALARVLRERFPLAMIDEFQDTDPIQYSIFSKIYGAPKATLFLIGDPKQSIYSFRGADLHAYMAAAASEDLTRHSLDINWRSDPGLVEAINGLYTDQKAPFLFPSIVYRNIFARPDATDTADDEGNPVSGLTLAFIDAPETAPSMDRKLARRLCAKHASLNIRSWLTRSIAGKTVLPKDIAVLTRSNDEALQMQQALRALDIQSSLATDTSVLSTPEATQFITLLRALLRPNDSSLVASALLTRGFGVEPNELSDRLKDPSSWDLDVERFVHCHDLLLRHGIFAAIQLLFDTYDVTARLLQQPGGERQVANLYHLLELAELQRVKHNLLPAALLRFLLKSRQDPSDIANESRQLRIESDEHAVVITTVHRSKGLEYPIVLCPFLWADPVRQPGESGLTLYHDDTSGTWAADLRGKQAPAEALAAAAREQVAENLRLIYVALTRARHATITFVPEVKGFHESAIARMLAQGFGCTPSNAEAPRLRELHDRLLAATHGYPSVRVIHTACPEVSVLPHRAALASPLKYEPLSRRVAHRWVASSFSALVAGKPAHTLGLYDEEGKDVDAQQSLSTPEPLESAPARFAVMPPGANSGDTLHKIFETIDFAKFDPITDKITPSLLTRHGVQVQQQSASVQQDIAAVLDSPLLASDPSFTLRQVHPKRRRSELQFSMGVGFAPSGSVINRVSPRQLASVLNPEATGLDLDYSRTVEQLGFEPLAGYLRGFIDLVFEHQGRTYVIDYKSTSIAATIAGFTPDLVKRAVRDNHYALQTALYALVMHRYLGWRMADYDYERDFGGTLLVFVRGVCPTQTPGHSVFFHRATRSAIDALDSAFTKTAGA